jgi:phospholipid-binding lipoprotein MlaA
VVPRLVRTGLRNFWTNLKGPLHIVNNFLQGQGRDGASESGRLLVNSTLGIGGFFDVATPLGFGRHEEDFGQTLAVWGVPDGPFVMVPFWGPQTLRDAAALPLDFLADPLFHYKNDTERYALFSVQITGYPGQVLAT